MRKIEVLLALSILLSLLVALASYASPDSTVDLNPKQVYETNNLEFNLTVNNIGGSEVIDEIRVNMNGFTITDMVNYKGWEEFFNNTLAKWFDGDLEDNVWGLFRFTAKAPLVDSNQSQDIEVITKGDSGEEATDLIPVIIMDDTTPPILTNNIPYNNGFLRQGITDQLIRVDAQDPETGILNITFSYWDCTNGTTGEKASVALTCPDITCSTTLDLSQYQEGDSMCFEFESYNNALDSSKIEGSVGFDGTPPTVELIAPEDGSYASNNTLFSFTAADNLAPVLSCDFKIDGNVLTTINANNNEQTDINYNMENTTEGTHTWTMTCRDLVDLEATAPERNVIIDRTPPTITLNSPLNGSTIGDGVLIEITTTDNYEVDNVDYSISLNSTELPEGENILIVTAADKAGNIATAEFVFIVDRTKPTLSLISPDDGASIDVHASFLLNGADNIDKLLDCILYIDNEARKNFALNTADTGNVSLILAMNDYNWKITCSDDAGNTETTEERLVHIVDLSGPDIYMEDITRVARGEDYPFSANITDPSGVAEATYLFDGNEQNLTKDIDTYSGVISTGINHTLGIYSLAINAKDTLNNPSSLTDEFELIQGYIITINLNPSSAAPSSQVSVSGTVTLDDGSAVPEDTITLSLPEQDVNVTLNSGSYSYEFTAPNADGTYKITASVISSDSYAHKKSAELIVASSGGYSASYSRSDGGGGGLYCGDGVCTTAPAVGENCKKCPEDCGECPEKPKEKPTPEPKKESFLSDEPYDNKTKVIQSKPRTPAGIGQASGWFNLRSLAGNIWAWAIFVSIVIALYLYNKESKKGKEKISWNNYFKER